MTGAGGREITARRRPAAEVDRTEHGMLPSNGTAVVTSGPGSRSGSRSGSGASGNDVDGAGADGAGAVGEASAQASERVAKSRRAAKRRWMRTTVIVVLCLAILAGAGLVAANKGGFFTPTHSLPTLQSLTLVEAQQRLHSDQFTVGVGGHQSSVTAPVGAILKQAPGPGTVLKQGAHVTVVLSSGPPPVPVPVLKNTTGDCPAITSILATAKLRADCTDVTSTTVKQGTVMSWTPQGKAPEGSTIVVQVSSGPPIETIPSLTGDSCTGATALLMSVGLTANCNKEYTLTGVPTGQVIDWNPNTTAPEGAAVTVDISEGPPLVAIPNVNGMSVAQAIGVIEQDNLNPGTDQGSLSGHVFATDPSEGTQVPQGTTITIYSK